jgi:hypothetical protein
MMGISVIVVMAGATIVVALVALWQYQVQSDYVLQNTPKLCCFGHMWYLGKDARQGMYLKFVIQHTDYNNGQPFNITINFQGFNQTKHYWAADVIIDSNTTQHLAGIWNLDDNLGLAAYPSANTPKMMDDYMAAYNYSLVWLGQYVIKESAQSLDEPFWGRIGIEIMGLSLSNRNMSITVPAGTFTTTMVGGYGSSHLTIAFWINEDLPYPVKGTIYETVPDANAKTIHREGFSFELLKLGTWPIS